MVSVPETGQQEAFDAVVEALRSCVLAQQRLLGAVERLGVSYTLTARLGADMDQTLARVRELSIAP